MDNLPAPYKPNAWDGEAGRTVYFDMDGTLADLYGVHDVFHRLDNNDASVYFEAAPIPKYTTMLRDFKRMGYRVGIITAGSRFPPNTPEEVKAQMNIETEAAKIKWLEKYGLDGFIDTFQFIPYGVSKYDVAEDKTGILVDDEDKVLRTWYSDRIKAINENKAIH